LALLAELMKQGALNPAIDRRYAMTEALDALLHLGTGRARGKIVITVP
jgi:NADPH:quinone reductase-like Zn-dependent oxidoreductase